MPGRRGPPCSSCTPPEEHRQSRRPPLEYPDRFEVRYVRASGGIRWNRRWVNISTVCGGEYVGLEEIGDGIWTVYFGPLKLGQLLERHMRIEDRYGRLHRRTVYPMSSGSLVVLPGLKWVTSTSIPPESASMRVPGSLSSAFLAFVRSRRVPFRDGDLLHVVVEVEGYRREDAREKKATMGTCWVPAGNTLRLLGRWAFAEPPESDRIDSAFEAKVARTFDVMIARASGAPPAFSA